MIKRKIVAILLLGQLFYSSPVMSGGIPVFDGANLGQAILQVTHLIETIALIKEEIALAEEELASIQGVRDVFDVVDTYYGEILDIDTDGILESFEILEAEELELSTIAGEIYDEENLAGAERYGATEESLTATQERFVELVKFIDKIGSSPDQKDILDLQARIDAESVLLQNELTNLTLLQHKAEADANMMNRKKAQNLLLSTGEIRTTDGVWTTPF
jgi:type IV secretion system protein VirB5